MQQGSKLKNKVGNAWREDLGDWGKRDREGTPDQWMVKPKAHSF